MRALIFASVIGALLLVGSGTVFADPAPTPTPNACHDNDPRTQCNHRDNRVNCTYGMVRNQFNQCVPVQPVVPQVTQCVGGQLVPQVVNNGFYNNGVVGQIYYVNGQPYMNGVPYYGVNGYNGYNGLNSFNGVGQYSLACVQPTAVVPTPVTNTVYIPVPQAAAPTAAAPAPIAPALPRVIVRPPSTGDAGLAAQ